MNSSTTETGSSGTYDRRSPPGRRQAFVLDKKLEDFITGCSPGCAITAQEVEQNLSVGYEIIPGSLRFKDDTFTDEENAAVFTVTTRGGGSILGTVTIKAVVEPTKVTAYSDICVLKASKGEPVALFPKGPEGVVARLLGQRRR